MHDLDKAILHLKIAAQDTSERALVSFYTPSDKFNRDMLHESVERLEKALAEYRDAAAWDFLYSEMESTNV